MVDSTAGSTAGSAVGSSPEPVAQTMAEAKVVPGVPGLQLHTAMAGVDADSTVSRTLVGLFLLLYAAFGTFFPYFNLYLLERGWSGAAVGTISALGPVVILISQPLWGLVNDRWGSTGRLLAVNGLLVGVLGLGYRYTASFAWLLFLTGLVALLRGPLATFLDAATLDYLGQQSDRYGHFRLYGSLGWAVTTAGMGMVADHFGLASIFWGQLLFFVMLAVLAQRMPGPRGRLAGASLREQTRTLLAEPALRGLAGALLLIGISFSIAENYFSILLDHSGGSARLIGLAWMGGAFVEILFFYLSPRLLSRWDARLLLMASAVIYSFRFFLFGVLTSPVALALLQLLDGVSFGAFNTAQVLAVNRLAPPALRATSQAAFGVIAFSLGTLLGAPLGGVLLDHLGPAGLFRVDALIAASAAVFARLVLPSVRLR